VWLGYRLGHLQGDGRVFRALVYNKGALVLHMLRRLLGDDVFFEGLRRFYRDSKFRKVGTGDVQRAFETESGQSLARFFERWIVGATTPALRVTWQIEESGGPPPHAGVLTSTATASVGPGTGPLSAAPAGGASAGFVGAGGSPAAAGTATGVVVVRLEQVGDVFDLPVTVTLDYASGASEDVLVRLTDRVTETRLPLRGPLREVEINRDNAALVEVVR
jgi:hypothetical protein